MAQISSFVNVTITTEGFGIEQAGFGIPLILACNADTPFAADRIRSYTTLAAVEDDFATTTPEYQQARALFSQPNKPPTIKIGRLANKPTQRYKISVQTVSNSTAYKVAVNGLEASFTSDANATNDEIVAGLVAAINALTVTTTASAVGSVGSQQVQLLGDAAGAFDSVEVRAINGNADLLRVTQDHADPGLAADLSAIANVDNDWFFIISAWNSTACIDALSDYAEANEKLLIAASNETNIIAVASGSDTTSPAAVLKADSKARSAVVYHNDSGSFIDAAYIGFFGPLIPGSETWVYKSLNGVSSVVLTDTQRTNALAKNAGVYHTVAGRAIIEQGKVSVGEYIDVVRLNSLVKARIQEAVFAALGASKKVPYTDQGIAVVQSAVRGALDQEVVNGGLVEGSVSVSVPKAVNVPSGNKLARMLQSVAFSYQLSGAIHFVDPITGTVNV